jgi:hypothetical protein
MSIKGRAAAPELQADRLTAAYVIAIGQAETAGRTFVHASGLDRAEYGMHGQNSQWTASAHVFLRRIVELGNLPDSQSFRGRLRLLQG